MYEIYAIYQLDNEEKNHFNFIPISAAKHVGFDWLARSQLMPGGINTPLQQPWSNLHWSLFIKR